MLLHTKIGPVEVEIRHGSDPVDSYAESGYNTVTELELTDEELDIVNEECAADIQWSWQEYQIDRADYLYEDR